MERGFPNDDDFRCSKGGTSIEVTANGIYTGHDRGVCHYSFENVRLEGQNNWDE